MLGTSASIRLRNTMSHTVDREGHRVAYKNQQSRKGNAQLSIITNVDSHQVPSMVAAHILRFHTYLTIGSFLQ